MENNSRVVSTYRLQFSPYYRFSDAQALVDYLGSLGISHVYSSPVLESVPGSVHGYDVTDFGRIRDEIGGEKGFRELNARLRESGIGWIQDFVPNHMAMDTRNPYIWDILRNGRKSAFADFFDIMWDHPAFAGGKIGLPFLEKPYYRELESGSFHLVADRGIHLEYGGSRFPLSHESIQLLLGDDMPAEWTDDAGNGDDRLESLDGGTREAIRKRVDSANSDAVLMDRVLMEQHYELRYWKTTSDEVNYRRFFAVNGLICLKEENTEVFDSVHRKLLSLVDEGMVSGLRIDHIDGLFDPLAYLRRLRGRLGDRYMVVEKILEQDESLDERWPVEGTTGYDFLAHATPLFCNASNSHRLDGIYERFTGGAIDEGRMTAEAKLSSLGTLFQGVLDIIASDFLGKLRNIPYGRDLTFRGVRDAIGEVLVYAPVYRTYIADGDPSKQGLELLNSIMQMARGYRNDLEFELSALEKFMNGYTENPGAADAIQMLQQYMPAVIAKSVEDTLFYSFNRLISLNDVGMNPYHEPSSVAGFHSFNMARLESFPGSMNTLSTHDTKLSEDIRARINVISELPGEWEERVDIWREVNSRFKTGPDGSECPSPNEEYYFYQLLLGSLPLDSGEMDAYGGRLLDHLLKSIREAGANTSWENPDPAYERHYASFVRNVMDHEANNMFWKNFLEFQSKISFHGFLNSLGQKILQMAVPGVPDIYQGTETWNFNLVDPDNRREVDFGAIRKLHEQVSGSMRKGTVDFASMLEHYGDGSVKMLVTSVMLGLRRSLPELFLKGRYMPVQSEGEHAECVIAFIRQHEGKTLLVTVPRLTVSLGTRKIPVGKEIWGDTVIQLPPGTGTAFRDVFTGHEVDLEGSPEASVGSLLSELPFSVLESVDRP